MNTIAANPMVGWHWPHERSNPFARGYESAKRSVRRPNRIGERIGRAVAQLGEFGMGLALSVTRAVHVPVILFMFLCAFVFVMAQRDKIYCQQRLHFIGRGQRDAGIRQDESLRTGRVQRVEEAKLMALAVINAATSTTKAVSRANSSPPALARSKLLQSRVAAQTTRVSPKSSSRVSIASRNKPMLKRKS